MKRVNKHRKLVKADLVMLALLAFLVLSDVKVIHVEGNSMFPTLEDNTITVGIGVHNIKKNDVVVAKFPTLGYIVKRVVGTEGDHIIISDEGTYVNGELLSNLGSSVYIDTIVPEGYVYLVGDNRDYSVDSRTFGAVDKTTVSSKLLTTKTISISRYRIIQGAIMLLVLLYCVRLIKIDSKEDN